MFDFRLPGSRTPRPDLPVQQLASYWSALNRVQAVIEFALDGTIITANDNFLRVVGYELADVKGRHHSLFCEPDFARSPAYAAMWNNLRDGQFTAGEFKRLSKSGQEVWIQASYNPVLDRRGKPASIVKFATDITQAKLTSAKNAGYLAAIERSMGTIEFDLKGNVLSANKNFLVVLGYNLADIQGRHHSMFVDPDFARTAEYRQFWERLAAGNYDSGEYKRVGRDGRVVWIQASYNPILDPEGKPVSVVKFASDITATKTLNLENQGKVNALNRATGMIEFDLTGRILTANANFLNMIGYDLDEVVGKHHRVVCDPEYVRSTAYQMFWEKLNRGEFDAGRYMRLGKGHREIWIQATYNPIFDADGRLSKVVKFATDITDQVRAETHIRDNSSLMARAIAELSKAVDGIAIKSTELAEGTRSAAAEGSEAMADSALAMADIETASGTVNNLIRDVQEIAAKTNLLALNATIEASRAGEHGKGFAVVASEVNNLASRSASAAAQITQAMEGASERIEFGSTVSARANSAFTAIVATVGSATEAISNLNALAVAKSQEALLAAETIKQTLEIKTA